jgi:hypothetical protein
VTTLVAFFSFVNAITDASFCGDARCAPNTPEATIDLAKGNLGRIVQVGRSPGSRLPPSS